MSLDLSWDCNKVLLTKIFCLALCDDGEIFPIQVNVTLNYLFAFLHLNRDMLS